MLFVIGALTLLLVVWFWATRIRDLILSWRRLPVIEPTHQRLPENPPLISVIVPAHNEEAAITVCVRSVLEQDYPRFELIVVDDRSVDDTGKIAGEMCGNRDNCTLISLKDLPPGWTGKCNALHKGVAQASGEWLGFLDADTRLKKFALRSCLLLAQRNNVGLITLTPRFILETFWEKALQPIFAATCCILFPPGKVNDPNSSIAMANGMFYMIRRDVYEEMGGHTEVRDLAVEDVGIGRKVKAAGLGLLLANGRNLMETKMYDGFAATLSGWTRILSACMDYRIPAILRHLAVHVFMSVPVYCVAMYWYMLGAFTILPHAWPVLPLITLILMVVTPMLFLKEMGQPSKYAPLFALGNLFLIWVHIVMIKRVLCKDTLEWRGTRYKSFRYEPGRLDPAS